MKNEFVDLPAAIIDASLKQHGELTLIFQGLTSLMDDTEAKARRLKKSRPRVNIPDNPASRRLQNHLVSIKQMAAVTVEW